MAGNARSGRRTLTPSEGKLPRPGESEWSVRRFLAAVVEGVGADRIDPRRGDTLIAGGKAILVSLSQEHRRSEVEELRVMVDEAKAALRGARKRVGDERDKLAPKDTDAEVAANGAAGRATATPPANGSVC